MKLLCIVGPTASGKTGLAAAFAKQYNGEVVSADSMQIYREMNIGTAKPDAGEQCGVPHHMLDFLEPSEEYSAAKYAEDARACIADIVSRGKLPVVAGGTGLYIDALLGRVSFEPQPHDDALRESLTEAGTADPESLHRRLAEVDPASAERLPAADVRRVARALEVFLLTGETMTEVNGRAKQRPLYYEPCMIGLCPQEREVLYRRIDMRVDMMMQNGLEEEARALYGRELSSTARQAIGYKELFSWFSGEKSREEAIEDLKRGTRRYAKRQLTWFRRDPGIHWIRYLADVNLSLIMREAAEYAASCGIIQIRQ